MHGTFTTLKTQCRDSSTINVRKQVVSQSMSRSYEKAVRSRSNPPRRSYLRLRIDFASNGGWPEWDTTNTVGSYATPKMNVQDLMAGKDPFVTSIEAAVADQLRAGIDLISDSQVRADKSAYLQRGFLALKR
jgi:hypothetical protein